MLEGAVRERDFSVDDLPCGCLVTAPDRTITYANRYFRDDLGWNPDDLVGKNVEVLLTRGSRIFCDSYVFPLLMQEGGCKETQLTCRTPDGERIPVIANTKLLPDGRVTWTVFSAENRNRLLDELAEARRLSDEKACEAQAANRIKSAFLASMSHDLRTPLNAILGFGEVLSLGIFGALANPKQAEYVQHIRESGSHLLELITDLLDLSGIETDKPSLDPEMLPVRDIVRDIAKQFEVSSSFKKHDVQVRLRLDADRIYSEERVLRRIMNNLLSNSAKYAPQSSLIDVEVRRVLNGVEVSVIDDGPGFPQGREETMRNPFVREKASDDGLGIGLAIVDTLARQHGGEMRLSNEPGRGARVTVCFPDPRRPGVGREAGPATPTRTLSEPGRDKMAS